MPNFHYPEGLMKLNLHDRLLTFFSFFAGMGIAGCAMIGYGYTVPYAGAGFIVKQICLFMVLFAVAGGSLAGALVSEYKRNDKILLLSVLAAGVLVLLLPFYSNYAEKISLQLNGFAALVIYTALVLTLPIACISMVIPLTVAGLKKGDAGSYARKTGVVFAVIMMGIALGSMLYPMLIIPALGLIWSAIVTGFSLAIIPAIQIFRQGWRKPGILGILFVILLPGMLIGGGFTEKQRGVSLLDLDEQWQMKKAQLYLNGAPVSIGFDALPGDTARVLDNILENCFQESEILYIGPFSNTLVRLCAANNLRLTQLDVTGLNTIDTTNSTFTRAGSLNSPVEPRVFLNSTSQQFDIIILDLMRGDAIREGLFSVEVFIRLRNLLKAGGLGLIRLPDIEGEAIHWYGVRSLYKTIRSLGLFTEVSKPTRSSPSMLLFSGSRDAFDDRLDEVPGISYFSQDSIQVQDVRILTDNRPMASLYFRHQMAMLRQERLASMSKVKALK